ncbi:hypothetical protein D021_2986B, partial [Vibrio parahaemolyticus 10296]
ATNTFFAFFATD